MLPISLLVFASLAGPPTTRPPELWAGHLVTLGSRRIPFHGRQPTRADTWVLASVTRTAAGDLVLEQTACAVEFAAVAGVRVVMDARALPPSRVRFDARSTGTYGARSTVGWGAEDLDVDGNPGLTIEVQSRVCSGALFVSNTSRTISLGEFAPAGSSFFGRSTVYSEQAILGARGVCLNVVARDTEDVVRGPFAYVPVASGTDCDELLERGWPVDAEAR